MKKAVCIAVIPLFIFFLVCGYGLYLSYQNKYFGQELAYFSPYSYHPNVIAVSGGKTRIVVGDALDNLCASITRGSSGVRTLHLFKPKSDGEIVEISFGDMVFVTAQPDTSKKDTCILTYQVGKDKKYWTIKGLKTFERVKEAVEAENNLLIDITDIDSYFDRERLEQLGNDFGIEVMEKGFNAAVKTYGAEALTNRTTDMQKKILEFAKRFAIAGSVTDSVCDYSAIYAERELAVVKLNVFTSKDYFEIWLDVNKEYQIEDIRIVS